MNTTKKISVALLAICSVVLMAGKLSDMSQVNTLRQGDLFYIVTNSGTGGSRAITSSNLLNGIMSLSHYPAYQPSNASLTRIAGTRAITNANASQFTLANDQIAIKSGATATNLNLYEANVWDSIYYAGGDISVTNNNNASLDIKEENTGNVLLRANTTGLYLRSPVLSLDGLSNVVVGSSSSLANVTTAAENVGVGVHVFNSLATSAWNTAVGSYSQSTNSVGTRNTSIGFRTLMSLLDGNRNFAGGTWSLAYLTNGDYNIGIGSDCMFERRFGNNNIGIGFGAGYWAANGDNNVLIGHLAGERATNVSSSIFLGPYAGQVLSEVTNVFVVDSFSRTSTRETIRTNAILYGQMDTVAANQRLTVNGRLGIQTTNPVAQLHVEGLSYFSGQIEAGTGIVCTNSIITLGTSDFDADASIVTFGALNIELDNDNDTASSFRVKDGGNNTKFRVTETGFASVNTESPTEEFTVVGDVHIQGFLCLNTNLVTLTADNQVVATGARSVILLSSDNVTASARTIVMQVGQRPGQVLTIAWLGTNAGELIDDSALSGGGNIRLSADWTPTDNDTLSLLWTGTDWLETARSAN